MSKYQYLYLELELWTLTTGGKITTVCSTKRPISEWQEYNMDMDIKTHFKTFLVLDSCLELQKVSGGWPLNFMNPILKFEGTIGTGRKQATKKKSNIWLLHQIGVIIFSQMKGDKDWIIGQWKPPFFWLSFFVSSSLHPSTFPVPYHHTHILHPWSTNSKGVLITAAPALLRKQV